MNLSILSDKVVDFDSQSFMDIVIREVDMGFTSNPFFDETGEYRSSGCQRISYCSCDCNHCANVFSW